MVEIMIVNKVIYIVLTFFFAGVCSLYILSCGGNTIAGGTGAGNPGKTTVAIVTIPKKDTNVNSLSRQLSKYLSAKDIPVYDTSCQLFNVSSAKITVKRIHFIPDSSSKDSILLLSRPQYPLEKDSESIFLNGPFLFDVINGTSTPHIDTLQLPSGKYRTVRMVINEGDQKTILLEGNLNYRDTVHNFSFQLPLTLNVDYQNKNQEITIAQHLSTEIKIVLDASKWLYDVNIRGCIDSGALPFESDGTLIIDGKVQPGPCLVVPTRISVNIVHSGSLNVIQVPLQ